MKRRSFWITLIIFFLLLGTVSPVVNVVTAESKTATVLGSSVNVRQGPGLSYPVISSAKYGETYTIVGSDGDWVKIQLKNGSTGWIAGWLVSQKTVASTQKSTGDVTSNATGLRIRSGPGTSFQIIGYFQKGEKAEALGEQSGWVNISYKGQKGWVSKKYISYVNSSSSSTSPNQSTSHSTPNTGTVLASALNVRSQPNTSTSIVGKLYRGEKVSIIGQQGKWYQIKYQNKTAWVHGDFIQTSSNSSTSNGNSTTSSTKTGTVTASSLNVRSEGSLNGKVVGAVKKGTKLTILQEVNDWYEIKLDGNKTGWVASWYVSTDGTETSSDSKETTQTVTLLYNGTNLRSGPSTSHTVIARGNQGEQFQVLSKEGDWYKIKLTNGKEAFVAGWIVTTGNIQQDLNNQKSSSISGKKIILDPGHGGYDSGAVGSRGTLEKHVTLQTAKLVYNKLKAQGADVKLTRSDDTYISLNSRVYTSNKQKTDAFISIHYDSSIYSTASGITSFYYSSTKDKPLAEVIQKQLIKNTNLRDRGVKFGNFHVIRENYYPAVLLELGFLSNPTEEWTINTSVFQEQVSQAIYNGVVSYLN
ncbi:SH3 domain-containing protein [Bacillus kexueae]|uniref:SH3 domain-containing protein n=1 Tax=Aeribacillus kexueae TaxID=2078952 RepID=UPI001FB008E9|nr:SH3 domain-containing protein [Bacillus kexueae]